METTPLRFLTDKNEWFVGIKKAVRLLNNSEEYTGLHLENLHSFFGEYSSFKRETDESWLEGDEYLPEGWRYKVVNGSNGDYARVLSPKGESFSSKSKALAYMVKNNYEEADVKKMMVGFSPLSCHQSGGTGSVRLEGMSTTSCLQREKCFLPGELWQHL